MSKHHNRLGRLLDRCRDVCPREILTWLETSSEADGSLYARLSMIHGLISVGIDVRNANENEAINAIKSRAKSRGRVSMHDISVLELLIRMRAEMGLATDNLRELRRVMSRKATKKSREHIRINACEMRDALLSWIGSPTRSITEARDKALLAILIFIPLRARTLHLLRRDQLRRNVLYIEPEQVKNRKAISPRLPTVVRESLDAYLSTRTDSNQALFAGAGGRAISQDSIQRSVTRRTKRVLGTELSIHDFRRIIATIIGESSMEAAAALLVVTPKVLVKHYDLRDSSQRLNQALKRFE